VTFPSVAYISAVVERLRARLPKTVPFMAYAWCLLLFAAALYTHLIGRDGWVYHLDLDDYLHATRSWVNGEGLYDVTWWIGPTNAPMTFNYPPFAALVLRPLASMSYPAAASIVTVGSLAALWVAAFCISKVARLSRGDAVLVATMATALGSFAYPVWSNLNLGQINISLMALAILDITAPWRWWPRGLLIGLTAAVKLTPLGLALYFVLKRDWRALITALAAAASATAVAWVIDPTSSRQYWGSFLQVKESVSVLGATNVSLAGVVDRLPLPSVRPIVLVCAVLLVTALAILAARNQLRHGASLSAALAIALLLPYVSPVSWFHHWVWVVPVLLAMVLGSRGGDPVWVGLTGLSVAVLFSTLLGAVPGMWLLLLPWGVTVLIAMATRPLHLRSASKPSQVPPKPLTTVEPASSTS
jgi:alpha-1,2-mannosyltransferase